LEYSAVNIRVVLRPIFQRNVNLKKLKEEEEQLKGQYSTT
jgi:hypothetical protein